jgi:hypothetical protein
VLFYFVMLIHFSCSRTASVNPLISLRGGSSPGLIFVGPILFIDFLCLFFARPGSEIPIWFSPPNIFFLILVFGAKTHSTFVQLTRLSKAPVVGARSMPEWPPLLGPGARAGSRGRLRFPTASTGFSLKRRHQLSSRSVPRLQCSASGFVRFAEDFSRSVDSAARIQVFSSV